jgi:hypothetical protein
MILIYESRATHVRFRSYGDPDHRMDQLFNGMITPRKTYEIKFLDRIRGALTAAPTRELPVNQIPQAAPTTESPRPNATPKLAYPYGDMWVNTSPHP